MPNNVDMGQVSWTVKASSEEASNQVSKLSSNINGLSKVLKTVNVAAFVAGCRRIGQTIYNLVKPTTEYIQTMNRFKSIMGESANEAQKFIDKAEAILGLDPEQMMTSLSSFQTLTKGFGISSDEAYKMSKNLTQLAADMSSFTGESMDLALQRIKSGISGEIEPMRKWGIALDQATLQETAYALGINKRVAEMTRAQKTELAYYQIMHATQYAQGNMARTLLTPANALRVVQTEFKQLARAMGSIFIPIVMKIIPYVRALTQILTELAKKIAAFFGFKMSDYEFSASPVQDIASSFGDVEDNVGKATKALKKMLMPFDELNNVNFDTGSASGGGVGNIGGGSLGIDTYDYDMFAGASDEINKKVQEIKDNFQKLLPILKVVGGILVGLWTVNKIVKFVGWIQKVVDAFRFLSPVLKPIGGVVSIIAGGFLYLKGILEILNPKIAFLQGLLKALVGALLVIGGLLLLGASTVAIVVTAIVAAVGIIGVTIYRFRDQIGKFFTQTLPIWFESIKQWFSELPGKIGEWHGRIFGEIVKFLFITLPNAVKGFFTETLPEWGRKIGDFFTKTLPKKLQDFGNWIKTLPAKFLEFGKNIVEGLINGVKNEWERFKKMIKDFVDGFIKGFKETLGIHSPSTVFSNIGMNIIQGLIDGIKSLLNKVKEIFENLKNNIIEKFENMKTNIFNKVETIKNNAITTFNNMKMGISEKISNIKNNIITTFENIKNSVLNKVTTIKNGATNILNNMRSGVINVFNNIKNGISDKIYNIKTNISNTFSSIKEGIVWRINQAKDAVGNAIDRIKGLVNFHWSLPHLKTPHLYWSTRQAPDWMAKILSALNLPASIPKLNIEWYAQGGFPKKGQLFGMNENGPELIGNIGHRTAIANQQQITDGIAEATYNAFTRALNENKRDDEGGYFVINLDGNTIYQGYAKKKNQYSNMYGLQM